MSNLIFKIIKKQLVTLMYLLNAKTKLVKKLRKIHLQGKHRTSSAASVTAATKRRTTKTWGHMTDAARRQGVERWQLTSRLPSSDWGPLKITSPTSHIVNWRALDGLPVQWLFVHVAIHQSSTEVFCVAPPSTSQPFLGIVIFLALDRSNTITLSIPSTKKKYE